MFLKVEDNEDKLKNFVLDGDYCFSVHLINYAYKNKRYYFSIKNVDLLNRVVLIKQAPKHTKLNMFNKSFPQKSATLNLIRSNFRISIEILNKFSSS